MNKDFCGRHKSPWMRGFLFAILVSVGIAQSSAWSGEIMTLSGRLLGLDQRPTSGTLVYLIGVDRMNLVNLEKAAQSTFYHARTNERGEFSFKFRRVHGDSVSGTRDINRIPGFGDYYLVVPRAKNHAGAISPRIVNTFPKSAPQFNQKKVPSFILLRNDRTLITLQLKRGITVAGRVLNPEMKGRTSQTLTLYFDLHAGTHTGEGGEIFGRTDKTDAQGRFLFSNVYPATFCLSVDSADRWIRTRLGENGPWIDNQVDQIDVPPGESLVHVDLVLSAKPQFAICGTVRDPDGRPIAGAKVTAAMMFHKEPTTWDDSHTYIRGQTDQQGNYKILLDTPWVRAVTADRIDTTRVGQRKEIGDWEHPLPLDRRYDFVLPPEPPQPAPAH